MVHFVVRGFRKPRALMESALGALERRVLEALWALGREASVRDLQAGFAGAVAYTTLMTTLDRLFKKGILARRRESRAFLYTPRVTPEQLRGHVAADVFEGLLGRGPEAARPVLSSFVDAVEQRDEALLDELEALVRRRRRERARRGR
jgi:predicted transcriptional regulator